jgi:hypothetical protein
MTKASNSYTFLTGCLVLLLGKPTMAGSHLRGLQIGPPAETAGNNGEPASAFPLQQCQADCDWDGDCDYGLVCLQRSSSEGNPDIPGCSGTPEPGWDYCVVPDPGHLVTVGNNGSPAAVFSAGMGVCEGDCDEDSDCQVRINTSDLKFDCVPTQQQRRFCSLILYLADWSKVLPAQWGRSGLWMRRERIQRLRLLLPASNYQIRWQQ